MISRADLDRVEDSLRSELAYYRGRIDGIYEKLLELDKFRGSLKEKLDGEDKRVENIERRLDRLFYLFVSLLLIIIGSLISIISKLMGWW